MVVVATPAVNEVTAHPWKEAMVALIAMAVLIGDMPVREPDIPVREPDTPMIEEPMTGNCKFYYELFNICVMGDQFLLTCSLQGKAGGRACKVCPPKSTGGITFLVEFMVIFLYF